MPSVGWVRDDSEASLRGALARAAPELARLPLRFNPRPSNPDPRWWSASAVVDRRFIVKFAWSAHRAVRLWREGVVLQRLHAHVPGFAIPEVVHVHGDPAVLITRRITPSAPLSWEWASALTPNQRTEVTSQLGAFLARLHADDLVDIVDDLPPVEPTAQADTARLRREYPALVDTQRATTVLGWCEWVDDVLNRRVGTSVLVHGDLHGYNQAWDVPNAKLRAVVDFEECGLSDPHFDFRYLPGNARTVALALDTITAYQQLTHTRLTIERVMAWHTLTVLGDALWRTQAHVDLPGGGDAASWVDDLAHRLDTLNLA